MRELYELIEKFNKRAKENEKLKRNLEGLERKILINFSDDGSYSFILKEAQVLEYKEKMEKPDITVNISTEIFHEILNKKLDVLSAYITKKFTVKASLSDKLLISELMK
ncbi:MAG: SCP2 sterol-binding domain-containing protein [Thermoplasmata archaeon]